jgi:serine protease Do
MKAFIVGVVLFVSFGLPPAFSKAADTDSGAPPLPIDAVFRVRALNHSGAVTDGSAVLVAAHKLVTNCHVTRRARSIEIIRDRQIWVAQPSFSDIEHDLCVLFVPGLIGPTPADIEAADLPRLGDPVFAVGYPTGGKVRISDGQIKGLYGIDNGQLVQVSAPFDHGQSGGALFDKEGKLIGITSFKAATGGDFHFALPLSWIKNEILSAEVGERGKTNGAMAFWERPRRDQPLPLQAATLEADGKWEALSGVARKLTEMHSDNECTWLTLGRALRNLGRHEEAAAAFRRAAELGTSAPGIPE